MIYVIIRDETAVHKPIEHLFFTGEGNKLQFEDSCIAENVMLQFVAIDAPALPVHDSFIMHHGYGGDLKEPCGEHFMKGVKVTFQ